MVADYDCSQRGNAPTSSKAAVHFYRVICPMRPMLHLQGAFLKVYTRHSKWQLGYYSPPSRLRNFRHFIIFTCTTLKMTRSSTSTLASLFAFFGLASLIHCLPSLASRSASSGITWSNCTASDPPSLDCGSIQVHLDHSEPNGANITLAIARLKAPEETRKGNILYNPGGPGGSATQALLAVAGRFIDFLSRSISCSNVSTRMAWFIQKSEARRLTRLVAELGAQFFSQNLLDNYDIIGVDPRGVGLSAGISCDPDLWNARQSIWPKNEKEFDDMVAANKAFYASCTDLTGPLFDHVDTTSVAKDFEIVRLALGDEKLNIFAQSYGSQIGEQYAELFPENIGRMALDAVLDHSTSEVSGIFVEVSRFSAAQRAANLSPLARPRIHESRCLLVVPQIGIGLYKFLAIF